MKTFIFKIVLVSVWLFATNSQAAEAPADRGNRCPEWKASEVANNWRVENSALGCRSSCTTKQDCAMVSDPCGRVLVFNKKNQSEIEGFLKLSTGYECANRLDIAKDIKLDCRNKRCEVEFGACEVEKRKLNEYIAEKLSTKCSKDQDCTFFLSPGESCIHRLPVTSSTEFQTHQLNLAFLREAVMSSCKNKTMKECDATEKSFCVASQCVVLSERPEYKNFLNLEGPDFLANYKSNTTPVKMPEVSQSKCSADEDCVEMAGICTQYLVTLNKKFATGFKTGLDKMAKSVACPSIPKIKMPKSRCFKKFCSFVN